MLLRATLKSSYPILQMSKLTPREVKWPTASGMPERELWLPAALPRGLHTTVCLYSLSCVKPAHVFLYGHSPQMLGFKKCFNILYQLNLLLNL